MSNKCSCKASKIIKVDTGEMIQDTVRKTPWKEAAIYNWPKSLYQTQNVIYINEFRS